MPHHLLDVWPVTRTATGARTTRPLCRAVVDALLARGVVPVLVGGSGLYLRAALDDLEFPGHRPGAAGRAGGRAGARRARRRCTPGCAALDPAAAARMEPTNGRRIVRALEVVDADRRRCPAR